MVQRFTTTLPTYEPLFASKEAEDALERMIAMHFLRTGRFQTAETFIEVSYTQGESEEILHLSRYTGVGNRHSLSTAITIH